MALENLQNLLQFNLRALLPLMLIALVVMGNILFAATSILPRWTLFESLTAQIDEQKAVLAARAAEGRGGPGDGAEPQCSGRLQELAALQVDAAVGNLGGSNVARFLDQHRFVAGLAQERMVERPA